MNKTLRISYSLLSLWKSGRQEDAIKFYLKMRTFSNGAMDAGQRFDQYVADVAIRDSQLPVELGSGLLTHPIPHFKIVVPYANRCTFVGELDIWDEPTIHEIKTGNKDSVSYSHDYQVPLYFLLTEMKNLPCEKAIIHHYNESTKELDRTLLWKTPDQLEKARNFIDSLYPEILSYFDQYNLWEKMPNK